MEWHIEKQDVVSVDATAPESSKGSKKGVWHRSDGTTHEVEIIEKNSLGTFQKWRLQFSTYYVETQDHILVLQDKHIIQDPEAQGNSHCIPSS